MTHRDLRVEEIAEQPAAEDLSGEWTELMDRALDPEPFLTPEWYLSWWRAFGSGRMKLVVVRLGSRLVGLAPLRVESERLLGTTRRVLRFWSNPFSNRANVVLDREHASAAARALVRHLFRAHGDWDLARLGPVLRSGEATRALQAALDQEGALWGLREGHASPYLVLPGDWSELEGTLGGSYRRSLRRKRRKVENQGASCSSFSPASLDDVEAAFRISERTWQHEHGTGLTSQPRIRSFYENLAAGAARRGWLHLAYLHLDGRPVAFEYNLLYRGVLYNLKLGYESRARSLSPGLVLKGHVLQEAVEEGVREYDFLGEEEPYKMHWTRSVRPLGELWIHRRGPVSWLLHRTLFSLHPFLERRAPWVLEAKRHLIR